MVSNWFPRPYRGRRCGTKGAAARYLDVGVGSNQRWKEIE
jgi:hypothetical protein